MKQNILYDINIKNLNEFNQLSKKVFIHYYMFSNGIVFGVENDNHLKYGEHFVKIAISIFNIEKEQILYLSSDAIFKTIRDNKKIVKKIISIDNYIYLTNTEADIKFLIGELFNINDLSDIYKKFTLYIQKIEDCNTINTILPLDSIDKLNKKQIITFSNDNYKVRLTNKLIPLIKKSDTIDVYFNDMDKNVFETIIICKNSLFSLFHKYTCIKF